MHLGYTVQRIPPAPLTGSENYILDLARFFAPTDEVTVLATHGRAPASIREERDGFGEVLTFPSRESRWTGLALRYLMQRDPTHFLRRALAFPADGFLHSWTYGYWSPAMLDWLAHSHVDVLHCQAIPLATTWIGWTASRRAGIPLVITPALHPADPDVGLPYIHRMLRYADAVIAQTETERTWLLGMGISPDRTWVIPPAADLEGESTSAGFAFRSSLGISSQDFVIVIPRKLEEKGTFHTLKAIAQLSREGRHPVGIVLGSGVWPIQLRLDAWIARLRSLGTRILDLGFLPRGTFRHCLSAADVVVQPSKVDSFGLVYQDAWLAGTPVIAASIGGIPEIVRDGENGLLVPYGSSAKIADAVRLLMDSPDTARRLGSTGRQEVRSRYDIRLVGERMREVYETVVDRRRAAHRPPHEDALRGPSASASVR